MNDLNSSISEEFVFTMIFPQVPKNPWNPNLEIIFILQGEGVLYTGKNNSVYTVCEKDIFVMNPFELYTLNLKPDALALSLSIPPSFVSIFYSGIPACEINCHSYQFDKTRQKDFDIIRKDLAHAFQTQYKNKNPIPVLLRSRIGVLLGNLIKNFGIQKSSHSEYVRENYSSLRTATDFIHHNYQNEIALRDLAKATYLSTSYISHMFQKQLGQTFTSYLSNVRLTHAIPLLDRGISVTEVAEKSGFPSSNAFINGFKKRYGMTPGHYKKQMPISALPTKSQSEETENFSHAFSSLMEYADTPEVHSVPKEHFDKSEISCDILQCGQTLQHKWRTFINAGYAKDLFNINIQNQIRQAQKEIGYKYIRCKGYLDDDMMVCMPSLQGTPVYNFVYVDEAIDFIVSLGALPWIEIGHMPAILAKTPKTRFMRPSIISMPHKADSWLGLVEALLQHLNNRYGESVINKWLFTPLFSPAFSMWGWFTMSEYMPLYSGSHQIIRQYAPAAKIISAPTSMSIDEVSESFWEGCAKANCLADIAAFNVYHNIDPEEEGTGLRLRAEEEAFPAAVSGDEQYLNHKIKIIKAWLDKKGIGHLPVYVSEWSNNVWQRDLCNDTSYKSAYIFKNVLENYDKLDGIGYWAMSDQFEEMAPSAELFHGGFGLFTRKGLPKAAYRAFQLLKSLGDIMLKSGNGFFISRSYDSSEVQIFLYNYTHYDTLYRYRHTTALSHDERYKVFNFKNPVRFHINLLGLPKGCYAITRQSISPAGGSAYDVWALMGAPQDIGKQHLDYINRHSVPLLSCQEMNIDEHCHISAELMPHEVQLINIALV